MGATVRTREEIQSVARAMIDGSVKDSVEQGNELVVEVLLDIRDLLLASERRTEQFTEELQRLRK